MIGSSTENDWLEKAFAVSGSEAFRNSAAHPREENLIMSDDLRYHNSFPVGIH